MLNIEKYRDDILNAKQSYFTCSVSDIFLKLSHISCTGNCKECKKNIMKWLLSEYKEPTLDDVEKEYLSAIIKPFRKIIVNVSKHRLNNDLEYIAIRVKSLKEDEEENMCFPAFKIGTMYKGMELDKKYSLEELGL